MNAGGSANPLAALLRVEFLLRSRRPATLLVMLAVLAISWLVVGNPAEGTALVVVGEQRLRYDSQTLAFGSAHFGGLLLGLAGFYLARGRMQEDLRCGLAGVLAATPVANSRLLLARFLGALLFLFALMGVQLLGTWALHALRGEGPWQPGVYLQHYLLLMTPGLILAASCATLCDAWAPLMGRRGDVAYFFLWVLLLSLLPLNEKAQGLNPSLLFDIHGLATTMNRMVSAMGTSEIGIGGGEFNAALPLRDFPVGAIWTAEVVTLRLGSALLALAPLLPALALFHRYRPDRVRARSASAAPRRLQRVLAAGLAPATRSLARLLPLLARAPAPVAAIGAELLLSLITQPLALLWLLLAWLAPLAAPAHELWGWQAGLLAAWALWAAELGARDGQQAGTQALVAALPGGAARRALSRFVAAWLLGLLGCASLLLRRPELLPALSAGLAAASAAALALGRLSGGSRAFLALFLFWLFVTVQVRDQAWLDWLSLHSQGDATRMAALVLAAVAALGITVGMQRRR